jgi:hypothetical protein
VRPDRYFRQFVSLARAIDVPVNFFVLEDLADLVASWVVVAERSDVVYHVGKYYIILSLI